MKVLLARFARDESGSAAVEYGLIAAAMSAGRHHHHDPRSRFQSDDLRFRADRPQVSGTVARVSLRAGGNGQIDRNGRIAAHGRRGPASVLIDGRGCGF